MRRNRAVILGQASVRSGAYGIVQAWCFITVESSGRHQHMASPRFISTHWLLPAATLVAALVANSAAPFAQVTGDETAIMNTLDHAVRAAEFGRAAIVLRKFPESRNPEAQSRLAPPYPMVPHAPHAVLLPPQSL